MEALIRYLERLLKIDLRYLATGGFWLVVGQVAASGSSFVLALAFANLLPPEQYGVYRYVLAAAALLAIPTLSGINTALTKAVAAGKEETATGALKTKLVYGLLGSVAALLGSAYYLIQDNLVLSASFALVAVFLPAMEAFSLYSSFLVGRKEFRLSNILHATIQIAAAAGVIAVLFFTKDVVLLIGAYFVLWTAGRAAAWYFVAHHTPPASGGVDEHAVGFGKHLSAMGIIGTLSQSLDRVFLFQHLGGAEVALYSIAIAMPEQIRALFKGTFELLLPRFSNQSMTSIRGGIWRKFWLMSAGLLLAAGVYVVCAPVLFHLLFPLYTDGILYSQIFALSLLTLPAGIFVTALQAHQRTRELYVINTIGPILQIILIFTGIVLFGILGAIVARVSARFINAFITALLYWHSTRSKAA